MKKPRRECLRENQILRTKKSFPALMVLVTTVFCVHVCAGLNAQILKNRQYELVLLDDHAVEVRVDGVAPQILSGEFTVMYSPIHLGFAMNRVGEFDFAYPRPFPDASVRARRWPIYSDKLDAKAHNLQSIGVASGGELMVTNHTTGEDNWVFIDSQGYTIKALADLNLQQTLDPFLAGRRTTIRAIKSRVSDRTITWNFQDQAGFALSAEIFLPHGDGDPQITYHLEVRENGYYSMAYTGTPWLDSDETIPVPQAAAGRGFAEDMDLPGFRETNIVISEAFLTLPRAHVATNKANSVIVIDPKESPFRLVQDSKGVQTYALGSESNSRFGMMIQKNANGVRPVALTPIMAGYESRMFKGDTYRFTIRYVLRPGEWQDTYKYIAKKIYDFRDMRDNSGAGSMSNTLENIMDYLSDRSGHNYAMWHTEQKYYNYWSDRAGNFKPFSPMFSLAAAIMTDDESFYKKHALPIIEFALSRKTNTFQPYDVINTYMAQWGRDLGSPYPDVAQLAELYGMFQNRTYAFKHYFEEKGFEEDNYMHLLSRYRIYGNAEDLENAMRLADKGGHFMDQLEMYEKTGYDNYLKASVENAYRDMHRYNLFPMVPDTMLVIEKGNKVPIHGHAFQRHRDWGFSPPQNIYGPEQTVPAWRVSLVGVQLSAYRGGYWISNHGQLMRLATHAQDDFIRDMQRWAMVGRYANYPGDFRSIEHSLVAEMPDAPMRYIYETNFSTFNPGHAIEWIGAVMDFLVNDCFNRSDKNIDFPSRTMYGSAFRVKTYGDRAGKFYDETNVRLWLPRKLLTSDNRQVDYLAGYGNGKLYIVFWNQSFKSEKVKIDFDPEWVDYTGKHTARVWKDNKDSGRTRVHDNSLEFEISSKGIIAYAIDDVTVKTRLHAKMFDEKAITLGDKSIAVDVETPFGKLHAMLITLGRGLTTSYVYTDALPENVISAKLRYRQGDEDWQEAVDAIYPYEFTTQIDEDKGHFEFVFEVEDSDQKIQKSNVLSLAF